MEKVIINDNNTVTLQNDRIRVTVPAETWHSNVKAAEGWSRGNLETPEQKVRGLILSSAMSRLANESEARALTTETPNPREVLTAAHRRLVTEYLADHAPYNLGDITARMDAGRTMSEGMRRHIEKAQAYADGHLRNVSLEDIHERASEFYSHDRTAREERDFNSFLKLWMAGGQSDVSDTGKKALVEAAENITASQASEISRRQAHSSRGNWQIEIIGEMPEQIGMCRFDQDNIDLNGSDDTDDDFDATDDDADDTAPRM